MGIAADERQALCDLFEKAGPDAPTLCGDWLTRDLAAHLVVRERRLDAAPGILVKPIARRLEQVQRDYAAKPWPELVELVRGGPAWYWPTRIGLLDEVLNTAEYFVHHEDVRRAQPQWQPRPADQRRDGALWKVLTRMGWLLVRNSPVGVTVRTPADREASLKDGPDSVTVIGEPGELLLFAFGREENLVAFEGGDDEVTALRESSRGL